MSELAQKAKQKLSKRCGVSAETIKVAQAPGRVNLIGEHTDYNDGFVLPVAIDREIVIAAAPRSDQKVKVYSIDFNVEAEFNLDDIEFNQEQQWINYLQGVAKFLKEAGHQLQGMNLALTGNVPRGAGLSSSAALEVATALTFELFNDFALDRVEMAKLCRRAENEFVGVSCGIMDQFISALGSKDHALFIDCRSHDYELVPMDNQDLKLIVSNTNVEHSLVDSAYNQRLKECQQGVDLLAEKLSKQVTALRDVKPEELAQHQSDLPPVVSKRVEHVVKENNRVKETVTALQEGNWELVGDLMIDSHASLRDSYEVSCEELDVMVELALEIDGVYGSRMTGAGFGGCTVSLVAESAVDKFKEQVYQQYLERTGIEPDIYVCNIEGGAREVTGE